MVHWACRHIIFRPAVCGISGRCYSGASQPVTAKEAMLLDAALLMRLQFFWVNRVFRGNVRASEEYR